MTPFSSDDRSPVEKNKAGLPAPAAGGEIYRAAPRTAGGTSPWGDRGGRHGEDTSGKTVAMIRFDAQLREITLSVRDLIHFDDVPALRPEAAFGVRARAGAREHRRHQQEARTGGVPGYRSEIPVEYRLERRGYRVLIQGRIDGCFEENGRWVVEEVKTTLGALVA